MNWIKKIIRLLKIRPATERQVIIQEPLSFRENVIKNKIWYRGDPVELDQFFKKTARYDVERARFWGCVPSKPIRKVHSGIVQITIDRLSDIVLSDLNGIEFGEKTEQKPIQELWEQIASSNEFHELLDEAITGALSSGDGAFKISVSPNNDYPLIEFFSGDNVEFVRQGRRIEEIKYYTSYPYGYEKEYRLEETYGKGYVRYKLFDNCGKEVELKKISETSNLQDITYAGDFIMGVPLIFFASNKWKGRGKALFDSKSDNLDSLDEIISQWADAVRDGRIKRYIPEDLIPRNPNTGQLEAPNPFDNNFVSVQTDTSENAKNEIKISQPDIRYESYMNSYSNFLDLCLQGIISPSTLGIDLKKPTMQRVSVKKKKSQYTLVEKLLRYLRKLYLGLQI